MPEYNSNLDPQTLSECVRMQYYYKMLIKSLAAKVERVEPGSPDFELTMQSIFNAKDILSTLDHKEIDLRSKSKTGRLPWRHW